MLAQELTVGCSITEIGSIGPVRGIRGQDPVPTGFDPINTANCTFNEAITSIQLELLRGGEIAFDQMISVDPPTTQVRFPLPDDQIAVLPADLETGRYDRRIQATTSDGRTLELLPEYLEETLGFQKYNALWVFDADSSPELIARRALSGSLDIAPEDAMTIVFEPVQWPDTSLGCPDPDRMYAQVVTPGFRFVFAHTVGTELEMFEYHVNEDGSLLVFC